MKKCLAVFILSCTVLALMCSHGGLRDGGKGVRLYPLKIKGKYGFINHRGSVVIKPVYEKARWFREGFAVVSQGGRQFHIDASGDPLYVSRHDAAWDFSEGYAQVLNRGLYSFINRNGEILFPLPAGYSMAAFDFSEGLASVEIRRRSGFMDTKGRLVIPARYDFAGSFSEGLACVQSGRKYGFIDRSGKTVIELNFDGAQGFSEGVAAVRKDGKWGYIDRSGTWVIRPSFTQAGRFSEGLAAAAAGQKWGYIDRKGVFVIPPKYRFCGAFSGGLAPVSEKGVLAVFDYIDKSGTRVCSTPGKTLVALGFEDGIARFVLPGGKNGYINKSGDVLGIDQE